MVAGSVVWDGDLPEHVLEEILLRDNPFDIENLSFTVGSETTTYTQEWGRRRSVVSVANQTAAARGRFCLSIGPHAELVGRGEADHAVHPCHRQVQARRA